MPALAAGQVFAASANGTLAENWFDPCSGDVGGGSAVGGMIVQGTPGLVSRSGQIVIDAFIRNSGGQIPETWYNWGTGTWGGWIPVAGSTMTSDPAAVATGGGHDQVFAAAGGSLEENWFGPGTGNAGDWVARVGWAAAGRRAEQGKPVLGVVPPTAPRTGRPQLLGQMARSDIEAITEPRIRCSCTGAAHPGTVASAAKPQVSITR